MQLFKIQEGIRHGKQYQIKYHGTYFMVKRALSIKPIEDKDIRTLNFYSMESIQPDMIVEIETNKGIVVKNITYYAIKEYHNPENIDPTNYKF